MKNKIITLLTIIGITFITINPANAWYRYGYGCCYGGYGYGGAMAGAAIAGAIIGGVIASQQYYPPTYYYAPPVYYYPYGGYYGPAYGYGYYGW